MMEKTETYPLLHFREVFNEVAWEIAYEGWRRKIDPRNHTKQHEINTNCSV